MESLKSNGVDREYRDDRLKGFGVRVRKSGLKSYFVKTRINGVQRRFPIGDCEVISNYQARDKAKKLIGRIADGEDPRVIRKVRRRQPSIKELGQRFLEEYVPTHLKPSTQREYKRSVELFITPKLGAMKVWEVDGGNIAELHHGLRHIPYQANRTLGVLSKMFNQAEVWGLRQEGSSPCRHIKKYKEEKRERFLSAEELKRLGKALQEEEQEATAAVAAYRLLILTGCRLGEIQTLQWDYVDLEDKVIRLPDSKTGEKTVYLNDDAVSVLKALPRFDDNPYVITGRKEGQYLTDLQKPWRRIRARAKLGDVRIHDLRHTYASSALALGQGLPMIGKLLGHTQVQTTARYAHLADDPVREAGTLVSNSIGNALFNRVA